MQICLKMVVMKKREVNSRKDISHYIVALQIFCACEIPRVRRRQFIRFIPSLANLVQAKF